MIKQQRHSRQVIDICFQDIPNEELDIYRDLFSSEYVSDVIYNHPERIKIIQPMLDKLHFIQNIHFVFTVIFDDFWKICENRDNAYRYQLKRTLLNRVRSILAEIHPASIAATLIGTDKVVVLLECAEQERGQAEQYARQCAELLRDQIMRQTTFSVSVGVSNYCASSASAWRAYEQSFQALSSSFAVGYGNVLSYWKREMSETTLKQNEVAVIAKRFAVAVTSRNLDLCEHHVNQLFRRLSIISGDESYIKSYVVLVLSEVTQYCIRLGMDANDLSQRLISMIQTAFQAGTIFKLQEETAIFLQSITGVKVEQGSSNHSQIGAARAYIEQFHAENISLNDVAQLCGYSDAYFCRMFKQIYGTTYTAFLTKCRIEHAKRLLEEGRLHVSEIAETVGFRSFNYFCTCFRKATGKTPSEYRCSSSEKA